MSDDNGTQPAAETAGAPRSEENEALAAQIKARDEEVEREITADLDGHAEAERQFFVAADAGIAAERQWAQDHNPLALAAINSMCDEAGSIIEALCSPGRHHRRAVTQ